MASGNDSRIKGRTHGRTDHQVHPLNKPLPTESRPHRGVSRPAGFRPKADRQVLAAASPGMSEMGGKPTGSFCEQRTGELPVRAGFVRKPANVPLPVIGDCINEAPALLGMGSLS